MCSASSFRWEQSGISCVLGPIRAVRFCKMFFGNPIKVKCETALGTSQHTVHTRF